MTESISVVAAGPLSREDIVDLVADLRRNVDTLTWRHERREEPDTLGLGQDLITAMIEHNLPGIALLGAGALLDKVISIVGNWFRARKSGSSAKVDITVTVDGAVEAAGVEVVVRDLPASVRVHIVRSEK